MGITETLRDEWDDLNQCQGIKHGLFLPQVLDVALIEKDTYVKSLLVSTSSKADIWETDPCQGLTASLAKF